MKRFTGDLLQWKGKRYKIQITSIVCRHCQTNKRFQQKNNGQTKCVRCFCYSTKRTKNPAFLIGEAQTPKEKMIVKPQKKIEASEIQFNKIEITPQTAEAMKVIQQNPDISQLTLRQLFPTLSNYVIGRLLTIC